MKSNPVCESTGDGKQVVVLGSLNMDLVVHAPRFPKPGETITGNSFGFVPGGKGANQAVAAARMGARVALIGRVGRDTFGSELVASLREAGVDVSLVGQCDCATGVALVTVSAQGENSIVVIQGANGTISAESVRRHETVIAGADALLMQLEVPMDAVREAARIASRHGVPVVLNPAPAQPLCSELLRSIHCLVLNESELVALSSVDVRDQEGLVRAARTLHDAGPAHVVLTLGGSGALALTQGGSASVPALKVEAIDTTAAGDAFLGAFVVAVTQGCTIVEAMRWGCVAGSLACTVRGAQPSVPPYAAVMQALSQLHQETYLPW